MRWLLAFLAGFIATLVFHQGVLALLYALGVSPFPAFSFASTRPLGVPAVISLAFWGGVWGIPLLAVLRKTSSRAAYWLIALVFGAIAPTVVAGFVVAPLKGLPIAGGGKPGLILTGLLINAAWGLGTAALFLLLRVRELPSSSQQSAVSSQ